VRTSTFYGASHSTCSTLTRFINKICERTCEKICVDPKRYYKLRRYDATLSITTAKNFSLVGQSCARWRSRDVASSAKVFLKISFSVPCLFVSSNSSSINEKFFLRRARRSRTLEHASRVRRNFDTHRSIRVRSCNDEIVEIGACCMHRSK